MKEKKLVNLKTRWYILRRTIQILWCDVRARLRGYCNNCPWSPKAHEGGGYAHWRCALPRHHSIPHRYRNYVWDDTGKTKYDPIDDHPSQPYERLSSTLFQSRRQIKVNERLLAERKNR